MQTQMDVLRHGTGNLTPRVSDVIESQLPYLRYAREQASLKKYQDAQLEESARERAQTASYYARQNALAKEASDRQAKQAKEAATLAKVGLGVQTGLGIASALADGGASSLWDMASNAINTITGWFK